jgi:nitrate/TMAO reductase-like tetraheme cytochrome c subunit
MVMPSFLILGLLLIALGMLVEWRMRRRRAPGAVPRFPRIDLNNPNQRGVFAMFVTFVALFVVLSAVGSYRAYEFTDSVEFCGELCHSVMHPEFTAYQASPHARVPCVECHVGAGATWYVRSKLSGARQVYATAFNKYPRPIPTPVANLRPAPETCEQCHWPKKFWGAQLKTFTHFSSDEKNTARQIRLLVKTGGGDPTTSPTAGIHWHMNIAVKIYYAASDARRQVIPYIYAEDMQGRVTEYMAKDASITLEQARKLPRRRMDCVDCHNRPTHIYQPPDRSVDDALFAKRLDPTLPFIKQQAVEVLTKSYSTSDEAMYGIATDLEKFYSNKYPQLLSSKQAEVRSAIAEVQRIFRTNTFPEMKLDWKTHANNIGHFYFAGCFRCHDGQHASADGKQVRKDCDLCHTIIGQEESGAPVMTPARSMDFKHPVDLGDLTQVNCNDCHTGGVGP